jgi:hypothetical protein
MIYYLDLDGSPVEVDATVEGKYLPATHWEPEEFPEVVINEVRYKGVKLPDLWMEVFADKINDLEVQVAEYPEPDYD